MSSSLNSPSVHTGIVAAVSAAFGAVGVWIKGWIDRQVK